MTNAMRHAITFLMIMISCIALIAGCANPPQPPATQPFARIAEPANRLKRFSNVNATELLVPFYEGILIQQPPAALHEAGLEHLKLAYPGPLSAPFVAWQNGDDNWTAVYSTQLDALPAQLEISTESGKLKISLSCSSPSAIDQLTVHGSWQRVVEAIRQRWKVKGPSVRLSDRFKRIDFYVHQWISPKDDPPLRVDWTIANSTTALICIGCAIEASELQPSPFSARCSEI